MKIPWSLVGVAAVLLPLGAYVAGTMAGSSDAPEQRNPIVVSGTLDPEPSTEVDPSATPPEEDPDKSGDGKSGKPDKETRPRPDKRTEPAKPKNPRVVRPNIDDDDDDDFDDDDDDDDDEDDDD